MAPLRDTDINTSYFKVKKKKENEEELVTK